MGVKLSAALGGSVELVPTNTASNYTATMPANTGTVVTTGSTAVVSQAMMATGVAGTGPAFSAYKSASLGYQTVTSSTYTLASYDVEDFDTASCFNNTGSTVNGIPAWSFLPNVAGYYLVSAGVDALANSGTLTNSAIAIFKNGSNVKAAAPANSGFAITETVMTVSALVYLNGSTDYVSIYGYMTGTNNRFAYGQPWTWFQANLARAA